MNAQSNIMKVWRLRRGISLIELVVAVMIGSMVLAVVFVVYSHARRSVAAMSDSLESNEMSGRILQLIAQDMDRFLVDTGDVSINLQPMRLEGLVAARLILQSTLRDNQMQAIPYERIVWEARYDIPTQSLILYRGHSGIVSEDKLLESQRTDEERRQLVPLCDGLTHFRIMAVVNGNPRDAYAGNVLPHQFVVSLSFTEPQQEGNEYVIPEEDIVTRTIAVNRARKISYIFTEPNLAEPNVPQESPEPNDTEGVP